MYVVFISVCAQLGMLKYYTLEVRNYNPTNIISITFSFTCLFGERENVSFLESPAIFSDFISDRAIIYLWIFWFSG